MEIKTAHARQVSIPKFVRRILLAFAILAISVILLGFGAHLYSSGVVKEIFLPALLEWKSLPGNYLEGLSASVPKVYLDINHENMQRLAFDRKQGLVTGILDPEKRHEVNARIRSTDTEAKVKVRLKGDLSAHWEEEHHWSFRVKVKGLKSFSGMKEFSLQHPKHRSYMNEWVFHRLASHMGLISLRYDFVHMIVNGKDFGIYAREEHFDKRLIEHNKYREGPIVRIKDDELWQLHKVVDYDRLYHHAEIKAFQESKYDSTPNLKELHIRAVNLLEGFRIGSLPVEEVFNLEQMAKFFALCDLFGDGHGCFPQQLRFYFNPVTNLLQPIGYDNQKLSRLTSSPLVYLQQQSKGFSARLFESDRFLKEYLKTLQQVSDKNFLKKFFAKNTEDYNLALAQLHRAYPWYTFKDRPLLFENQKHIRNILNPPFHIKAGMGKFDSGVLTVQLANLTPLPVSVKQARIGDENFDLPVPVVLEARPFQGLPRLKSIEIPLSENISMEDVKSASIVTSIHHLDEERVEPLSEQPLYASSVRSDMLKASEDTLHTIPFLEIDDTAREIKIKKGNWKLDRTLVLPSGYSLHADSGVVLELSSDATLIAQGPLYFLGDSENNIIVHSKDQSGGLVVLNASTTSKLSYVTFKGLGEPKKGKWKLTGSVTFYESPVDISYVRFEDLHSEDALNVIRTHVSMQNSLFSSIHSDALDIDFGRGLLENVSFQNIGNDAIDVSGSELFLRSIRINGAGDKGISAGEASTVSGKEIVIQKVNLGVSSKDFSQLDLSKVIIDGAEIGFAVFQKKPEFGPAVATVTDCILKNAKVSYLLETKSTLTINGDPQVENSDKLRELLYDTK